MVCTPSVAPVYRPRQPRQSPLYQVIERYYPEFERTYVDRYVSAYGPWRPVIGAAVRKFLRCGDLHFGFARVRCPDCGHEMFVPFSCRQRCLCPSCHQKRSLLAAHAIAHTVLRHSPPPADCVHDPQTAPHLLPLRPRPARRTGPRRLGKRGRSLPQLAPAGGRRARHGRRHPDLWRADPLPSRTSTPLRPTAHLPPMAYSYACRKRLPTCCSRPGKPRSSNCSWRRTRSTARRWTRCALWPHSGFSVNNSVYLSPGDTSGLERLAEYILRCPFSLARVVRLSDDGSIIYRAEQDQCRRFPGPASADLRGGPRRNFQVFSALDFLAELTQHFPNKGEHLVRYYGWYSHRQRGMRARNLAARLRERGRG